ncbi:hypothetical protein Egran_02085 [Elaphomyces granulatus]|uniref:Uncharacterized protein n=1 Tax=Elaphomyces granulatus TaxID=519963 RepID=A0A232M190_9EURO|nr:hypothetical protein Egran_02085 [Elaphomyces granulatus]
MAGRPSKDILRYKDEIIELFLQGSTNRNIVSYLSDNYNVEIGHRTLERRLAEWGVRKNHQNIDTPQLRARISVLFFQCCLGDKDILYVLQREGYSINARGLSRIRKSMGLLRRVSPFDQEESQRLLLETVQKELDKGFIEGFGRGNLYSYFRSKVMHIVSRDRLFAAIKTLDPDGVTRRLRDLQRHRGEYIIPGPNYLWSIDGYCKFNFWGFEMYASIDAYSRYITWIYVGITSRTAVSVLRQYLDTIESEKVFPQILRSDRGTETPLVAAAHYRFRQCHQPEVDFAECYRFGTSTANQRIEAWWGQLTHSMLFRWRDYFLRLSDDNLYHPDSLVDRITLLAIYMPILREEVHAFVRLWNVHKIRRQPNRPNCVVGQPLMLYHWPKDDVQNHGLAPDRELLRELQRDVGDWDIDEYLPTQTKNWCRGQLLGLGCPSGRVNMDQFFPDGSRAHCEMYLQLREIVREHIISGEEPVLEESMRPTGAWNWQSLAQDTSLVEEIVIHMEGRDELATIEDLTMIQ